MRLLHHRPERVLRLGIVAAQAARADAMYLDSNGRDGSKCAVVRCRLESPHLGSFGINLEQERALRCEVAAGQRGRGQDHKKNL